METPRGGWIGWLILVANFAFLILLTVSISAGHNWARITVLVLFIIGLLPYLVALRQIFAHRCHSACSACSSSFSS